MKIIGLKADGYRSLKKFSVEGFGTINVLFGLNNTGKSNILSLIECIFSRKWTVDAAGGEETITRAIRFTEGKIMDFNNNFYMNADNIITFEVELEITKDEIITSNEYPPFFTDILDKSNKVTIKGQIEKISESEADFIIYEVLLNKYVFFIRKGDDGSLNYLPEIKAIITAEKIAVFDMFINQLNELAEVITSRRYITEENMINAGVIPLASDSFKNWLFDLSLDINRRSEYKKIINLFNSDPFNYGEIAFSREDGKIEITVDNNDLLLPISRLGSGVQQLLILLVYIVVSKSKIVCIEELEINLSPKMQMEVLQQLASVLKDEELPFAQLFITSHSEKYDIKGAENFNKYYLKIIDGKTDIKDVTEKWPEDDREAWEGTSSGLWDQD